MASLSGITRRRVLAMLALLAAPAAAAPRLSQKLPASERIVIRNGWVLRASDIERTEANAA